jgi:sulfite oxidase
MATRPTRRLVHDADGLNTGTWPMPGNQFITPATDLFSRSHAAVPAIDPIRWRVVIDGLVQRPMALSLGDLERFPRREITATLICAGLRRDEFLSLGPLSGELPWGPEPAGTGRWRGFGLREMLAEADPDPRARYVEFVGLDQVERQGRQFGFGASVDLSKALGAEVLLATELNGHPLTPAHGFPVRAIVPGWIGARSVKWLGRITLLAEPSSNYFQTQAYRVQREQNPDDPRDVSRGTPLSSVAVNAVILEPTRDQVLSAGPAALRGWAIGCEGSRLRRVEVSADGGRQWVPAQLGHHEPWSWTLWESEVVLQPGSRELVVRATDEDGNSQPATIAETWNVKGYANNAWHRVPVQVR